MERETRRCESLHVDTDDFQVWEPSRGWIESDEVDDERSDIADRVSEVVLAMFGSLERHICFIELLRPLLDRFEPLTNHGDSLLYAGHASRARLRARWGAALRWSQAPSGCVAEAEVGRRR